MNRTLVKISSANEQEALMKHLTDYYSDLESFWIGLTYTVDAWLWFDGSSLSYHAWFNTDPVVDPNTPSVCAYLSSAHDYKWMFGSCDEQKAFACQTYHNTKNDAPTTESIEEVNIGVKNRYENRCIK